MSDESARPAAEPEAMPPTAETRTKETSSDRAWRDRIARRIGGTGRSLEPSRLPRKGEGRRRFPLAKRDYWFWRIVM